jgi:hypothetical protein
MKYVQNVYNESHSSNCFYICKEPQQLIKWIKDMNRKRNTNKNSV